MEKAIYSEKCELETRTAYQKGCTFPTMLRIMEICYEVEPKGKYPIKLFTNNDIFIMDDEQRLKSELEERYESLGEIDIHYLCHIVQTIPLYVNSQPLRERVYTFGKFTSGYSDIEGEATYDNRDRFIQGELVFVLKEDCMTVGIVICNTIDDKTCKLWVIGADGECYEEQIPVSRVLKYRDVLEHIDVETTYKLKKQLYCLSDTPKDVVSPIWLNWRFIETTSPAEEFGLQIYLVPIPNSQANKILGKEVILSDDGWHYRTAGDENKAERMLWGYLDIPISFDKTVHPIERVIQEGFPIGFGWRLRIYEKLISSCFNKDKSIEYHRRIVDRFINGYNEGIRQMSQNNIDILATHISMMEKQLAEDNFQLEQVDTLQSIIEKGKEVVGELRVIKSFHPYGVVDK